jgi:hypothetical protein
MDAGVCDCNPYATRCQLLPGCQLDASQVGFRDQGLWGLPLLVW